MWSPVLCAAGHQAELGGSALDLQGGGCSPFTGRKARCSSSIAARKRDGQGHSLQLGWGAGREPPLVLQGPPLLRVNSRGTPQPAAGRHC